MSDLVLIDFSNQPPSEYKQKIWASDQNRSDKGSRKWVS